MRPRRAGILLLFALTIFQLFLNTLPQIWLRGVWFDAYQLMMPRTRISAPAVIVAVDEKSLAQLGQWPWPRTLVARLLDSIGRYKPLAVGIDIIFAEADRLSPGEIADRNPHLGHALALQLKRLLSNDEALAAAIRRQPVVLGVAGMDRDAQAAPPRSAAVFLMQGNPLPHLWHFRSGLTSLKVIDDAAASRALLSADVRDRIVRRVPLVAAVGGTPFPSLGLETLRVGVGVPEISVRTGGRGIESVTIGDVVIPTDSDGHLWVRFGRHDNARYVSATDIMAGTIDPQAIAGKIVLLGVTGIGLIDQQATPLAERIPGIEVHAQVLENIFDGTLMRRPYWMRWSEVALFALLGGLLVFAVPAIRPSRSSLLMLTITGALLLLGIGLFRHAGVLFDSASPIVALNILFGGMLRLTLTEADLQRQHLKRQLDAEREAAARLAGELEAARRVQIGMLPVPSLAFWGEQRFDLHASMEPAKEVGGDLYDFFMVDDTRLFMLVGDVSGKGLPASIFMALSKALYKSTALRSLPDLGATMAEANVEITRENPELLFVTVIACLLDVESGELAYCNAGHELPHIVAPDGTTIRQLDGGGPPLCTLEDFPYETMRSRLSSGDSLVLVSDGVPEAMNRAQQLFGRGRVGPMLAAMPAGLSAEERVSAVNGEIRKYSEGTEQADDVTVLVVRWHGPRALAAG
ncbi:MAG TPA: CHASE2 domain-containing protein [Burkholderiales bacterium]|nr:CHASE2 domain-containing protein [Burkholderiales bacterium]